MLSNTALTYKGLKTMNKPIDIKLLKALNAHDRLLEKHRDDVLNDLKTELYAGSFDDATYREKFNAIYDDYESQMYRAWIIS